MNAPRRQPAARAESLSRAHGSADHAPPPGSIRTPSSSRLLKNSLAEALVARFTVGPIMPGAGKAYDASAFVDEPRVREGVPRIAVNRVVSKLEVVRRTRIDARTMRHATCALSQRCRKRIEAAFGRVNAQASMAKTRLRGLAEVEAAFRSRIVAHNLVRLPKPLAASPG